jgi:hypothetical protein
MLTEEEQQEIIFSSVLMEQRERLKMNAKNFKHSSI